MSAAEFDTNLIRLPLDYQGTPELAEIRVAVPSIVPPHVTNGEFVIGLELRDRWGFHLPKQSAHLKLTMEGASGEVQDCVGAVREPPLRRSIDKNALPYAVIRYRRSVVP